MAARKTGSTGSRGAKAKAGATRRAAPKRVAKPRAAPKAGGKPAKARKSSPSPAARKAAAKPRSGAPPKPARSSESSRERRFELMLHTTCLKAGTAAAASGVTRRVPMLDKLAPVLMGDWLERHSVSQIQEQLVRDVLDLYQLELSDPEEQGVILLATAARVGAGELSQRTIEDLVDRIGAPFGRRLLDRMLPLTRLVAENAAAVASTYAVGRRAQALCRLSRSDARDLGELLGNITGIDQHRLVAWSGEAFKLALKPFRSVLGSLNPLA